MAAKKAKVTGAPVAKTAKQQVMPSYIKARGTKYTVTKTPTGKIKITTTTGNTATFPKGTSIGKISADLQSGANMFTKGSITDKAKAKIVPAGRGRGGAGLGGMFGVKNR